MSLMVQHFISSLLTFVGPLALTLKALSLKSASQSAIHLRYLSHYWPAYLIVSFLQYGIQLHTNWDYYDAVHHFFFAAIKVWLFYSSGCVVVIHFVNSIMCAFSRSCLVPNDITLRYAPNIAKFERNIDAPARLLVRFLGAICRLLGLRLGVTMTNFEKIMVENPNDSFLYVYLNYTCHVPSLGEMSVKVNSFTSIFNSNFLLSPPLRKDSRVTKRAPSATFSPRNSASPVGARNRSGSRVETPKNVGDYKQRSLKRPSPQTLNRLEPNERRQSYNPDELGLYPSPEEFMRHRTRSDGNGNTSTRDAVRAWRAATYDELTSNDQLYDDSAILDLELVELKRNNLESFLHLKLALPPVDNAYWSDSVSSKLYPNMMPKVVSPFPHRAAENVYDVVGKMSKAPLINIDLKEKMQSFIDTI